MQDGGPAFPTEVSFGGSMVQSGVSTFKHQGMTLLDHFAGLAMQGLLANPARNNDVDVEADVAFGMGKAMLVAKQKLMRAAEREQVTA